MTGGTGSRDTRGSGTRVGDLYDWWRCHPRVLETLYELALFGRNTSFRRRAIETLVQEAGENVLEVGCGYGRSFDALRERIGPEGRLVGLDVSRGTVRSARKRVAERGWGTSTSSGATLAGRR